MALVGQSGSGKTTLLSLLGGLDSKYQGEVKLFGRDLNSFSEAERDQLRNRQIGFVFQSFHLLAHLSLRENVAMPLWLDSSQQKDSLQAAEEQLIKVGLKDRLEAKVASLSGGEKQRVAIARAMVHQPKLVLADEPTGNLDSQTSAEILGLFEQMKRSEENSCAIVVATHDPELAEKADRILRLEQGRLVESSS